MVSTYGISQLSMVWALLRMFLQPFTKKYPCEDVMIFTKFTPQIAGSDANPVKEMCHGLTVLVSTILMFLLDSQSG